METKSRPRTILRVSKTDDGDVEVALLVESTPNATQTLVLRPSDVPGLIELLHRHNAVDDPEDQSTIRNLRPVT